MNTNNMSDEELDKLFRLSAESSEPPFEPEAWTAMEKKLDKLESNTSEWHKFLYPLLLLLLLSMVGTVLYYANDADQETVNSDLVREAGSEIKAARMHPEKKVVYARTKKETAQEQAPAINQPLKVKSTWAVSAENKQDTNLKLTDRTGGQPEKSTQSKAQDLLTLNKNNELLPTVTETLISPELEFKTIAQKQETAFTAHETEPETALPDPTTNKEDKPGPDSSATGKTFKREKAFLSSLQLIGVLAPDFTTVRFKNADAISVNGGIMLGVPLSKKLSLLTGVLWANKIYAADPEEYTFDPYYGSYGKLPTSIDATCQVLDIPLNLSYLVIEHDKYNLALQAGFSSYIMLKEKYIYNYTYGSKSFAKTKEVANENRHWFGVQNIAVDYSRKVYPGLTVGVAPFLKFPLQGIGAGSVKLTSAGLLITAGYTIPLKNQKLIE